MAKILKQLVFGQKKNPPAPPMPDYQGEEVVKGEFDDHDYENISKFSAEGRSSVRFQEPKEPELVVFDNYSEPADLLRNELSSFSHEDESDPVYMAPIDEATKSSSWSTREEEDMYCVPYEGSDAPPPLPSPCLAPGRSGDATNPKDDPLSADDAYDVVPDISTEDDLVGSTPVDDIRPCEEYDEPWEWSVGARLTSSLQVSPSSPLSLDRTFSEPAAGASSESLLSDSESCCDEDEMTARQRRLYETAFDSRVKRDADDLDRLMQSPVLQGDLYHNRTSSEVVTRAASRSSFGSTSGSSASSTPTHQPMVISRDSPRQRHQPLHFTPTERRKVTLIRDHLPRSSSPQARILNLVSGGVEPISKGFVQQQQGELNRNGAKVLNTNYDRKISFNNQWDNVSRCSSDKSSSQESMNVVDPKDEFRLSSNNSKNEQQQQQRNFNLGKSASRDNLVFRDDRRNLTANYPSNWKELTNARLENSNQKNVQDIVFQKDGAQDDPNSFVLKKPVAIHSGVKVLPTDNTRLSKSKNKANSDSCQPPVLDPELKENNSPPSSEDPRRKPMRPTSLLSEVRPLDNVPQSPDSDCRPSDEYDPPWEFNKSNVLRVNGSVSVPERLSQPAACNQLSSSVTHDKLESEDQSDKSLPVAATKALPAKPSGLSSRPNLNLNLNLNSDSPRKARQSLALNFGCAALSAVGEKVDAELTLEKQGWYHGSISRLDAENLLRVLKEGSYLVRNSESSKQDYSLSLKSARGFMHMKIVHSDGRFILGQFSNPFSSIPEMIHHYSINKLPIKGAEHMSLLYPVIDQLL